jgi:hypothetical protein
LTSDLATESAGLPNPDGLAFEAEQGAMPFCQSEHALAWRRRCDTTPAIGLRHFWRISSAIAIAFPINVLNLGNQARLILAHPNAA